jgi:transcriptional regulator with XRE-family HTH domain
MTESERIEFLIRNLEGGSGAKFAQRVGMSAAGLSRIRSGEFGIRLKIDPILRAYPSINREWLETGEGYPGDLTVDLVKAQYEKKIEMADKVINHLMKRIEDLEELLQNNAKG